MLSKIGLIYLALFLLVGVVIGGCSGGSGACIHFMCKPNRSEVEIGLSENEVGI